MNVLASSFFEIFIQFLTGATLRHPEVFGLENFSPNELISQDFELAGKVDDYHFFEKLYNVSHHNRSVGVVLKPYFFQDQQVASGFRVLKGVRLTSLLKEYIRYGQHHPEVAKRMTFYFFHDNKDGAIIFDDSLAVRFSHRNRRDGYQVVTLERDYDEIGALKKIATDAIKLTMDFHELELTSSSLRRRYRGAAYQQVIKALIVNGKKPSSRIL
ncbi:hypothetical protein [Pseudomonas sp. W5-01]|uniref:hypothetical protein n=1 Tax=Pseudomonas sp. W5-01 TaxID=3097454 RepID=UPI00397D2C84